jgi:hypothetical protein
VSFSLVVGIVLNFFFGHDITLLVGWCRCFVFIKKKI